MIIKCSKCGIHIKNKYAKEKLTGKIYCNSCFEILRNDDIEINNPRGKKIINIDINYIKDALELLYEYIKHNDKDKELLVQISKVISMSADDYKKHNIKEKQLIYIIQQNNFIENMTLNPAQLKKLINQIQSD